jgi:chromosome segregation ATPase
MAMMNHERQELEEVKADRAKLLESSAVVTNKLREELTENTRYYTGRLNEAGATIGIFKDKLAVAQAKNQRLQNDLNSSQAQVAELRLQLQKEPASREEVGTKLSNLKQKSATTSELPEAANLLNQLKTRRKKFTASLVDIEAILEMIKES